MPDEPENPGGGSAEEAGDQRPTVNPPFDPVTFARHVSKPSPAPMTAVSRPASDDPHGAVTPPQGVARQAAAAAVSPQPGGGRGSIPRKKTPTSALSLVNAHIPSNLPPPLASDDPEENRSGQNRPSGLDDEHTADTVRRPILQEGGGSRTAPEKPAEREMADRVSLGDYSGALEIAEKLLSTNPDDPTANACAENCRSVLRQMYATRIGPLSRVPVVMVPRDQLRWLSIDHRAGFVLALVDGVSTVEMIIDVSGMAELDTLRILSELTQQRIISLR